MTDVAHVCPRCGEEARGHRFCTTCGLDLGQKWESPAPVGGHRAGLGYPAEGEPPKSSKIASEQDVPQSYSGTQRYARRRHVIVGVALAAIVVVVVAVAIAVIHHGRGSCYQELHGVDAPREAQPGGNCVREMKEDAETGHSEHENLGAPRKVLSASTLQEDIKNQVPAKSPLGELQSVSCPSSLSVGESETCNLTFSNGSKAFTAKNEGKGKVLLGLPDENTATTPTTSTESTETTPTTSTEPAKTTPPASTATPCPSGPIRTGDEQAVIESITASSTSCAAALRFVKDWAAINSKEPPAGFTHDLDGYTCTSEGGGARYSEVCHDQSKQVSFVVQWE